MQHHVYYTQWSLNVYSITRISLSLPYPAIVVPGTLHKSTCSSSSLAVCTSRFLRSIRWYSTSLHWPHTVNTLRDNTQCSHWLDHHKLPSQRLTNRLGRRSRSNLYNVQAHRPTSNSLLQRRANSLIRRALGYRLSTISLKIWVLIIIIITVINVLVPYWNWRHITISKVAEIKLYT